ncbi:U5 small nuclear ribonucleoprotein 40 kDa protein-like [Sycon ciliatum]|uniref:U5 small nuclear ribonucleoprotein 40 kDa protein-like n=1 Tax=Sycon ciliatum TaxID=27933 RepID=UPI0031F6F6B8
MASTMKRPHGGYEGGAVVPAAKKSREVAFLTNVRKDVVQAGPARSSSLLAPTMLLTGHEADIFSAKFHPNGDLLVSGGFDRQIYFWNVYGECENFAVLRGHQGPVMELQFSTDGDLLLSASTDKTGAVWDVETGIRRRRLRGHTSFVNSCATNRRGPQQYVTGSDDGMINVWDARQRRPALSLNNTYQVMAVSFNDTSDQVISGGLDNDVKVWDIRTGDIMTRLKGHGDTVTALSLSPDGTHILSNGMDNTVRLWDVRPFVQGQRQIKIFMGAQHSFEKNLLRCSWSPDGKRIAAGSADRSVYVWETTSRRVLYKLPGHDGSVNDVQFHPKEPVICSCSSDKKIFLGELH